MKIEITNWRYGWNFSNKELKPQKNKYQYIVSWERANVVSWKNIYKINDNYFFFNLLYKKILTKKDLEKINYKHLDQIYIHTFNYYSIFFLIL